MQINWFIISNRIENIRSTITQANHLTIHKWNPHRYHHLKTCRNKGHITPPQVQFGNEETLPQATHHKKCKQNKAAPATMTGMTDQVKSKMNTTPRQDHIRHRYLHDTTGKLSKLNTF